MKVQSQITLRSLMAFTLLLAGAGALAARAQPAQSGMTDLVEKAQAFKAMLSSSQRDVLQKPYTPQNGRHWTNLPDFACGRNCRNGVKFENLNAAQLAAAKAVIAAAIGKTPSEGYDEFIQVTLADSVLSKDANPGDFSNGYYYLGYLNEPSVTGAWMLQFGGHHYAGNIAFNKGSVIGVTPYFEGAEPSRFTVSGNRVCTPLAQEQSAFKAMLAGLTTQQLASAKIAGNFADVVLGPGKDANFPATKAGLKVGGLTALQQSLVLAAMDPYLQDADSATAAYLRGIYESELEGTYIGYAGNASLSANGHYVRIDGPSVWIELVVQDGVVNPKEIHYHSIWRDRNRDYGHDLNIVPVAVRPAKRSLLFSSALGAARNSLELDLHTLVRDAAVTIYDSKGGKALVRGGLSGYSLKVDIAALPKGFYTVRVEDSKVRLTSRFARL